MPDLFPITDVISAAQAKFEDCGLAPHLAAAVADNLVRADMMGHRTHGLALMPYYLQAIDDGGMATSGTAETIRDDGATMFIRGNRLPGGWLLPDVIGEMMKRSADQGVVSASIADCFHIGALQVYLQAPCDRKLMCLLTATDPKIRSVAPHGGVDAVTTSNPIACGIPTEDDPILIDMTTSVVSNATFMHHSAAGTALPGRWVKNNQGEFTDDPSVMSDDPPGTIAALGGEEFGYKGFALGMMVEALALALSGFGRTEDRRLMSEGVFVQIINPDYFAGRDTFLREMQALADKTRNSRPASGHDRVRYPGERSLEAYQKARTSGIELSRDIQALIEISPA